MMFCILHRRSRPNQRGFTLLEILIAAGVFGFVLLIATGLFVATTKAQKRIQIISKVQNDARFSIESMAQAVRLQDIDFAYYQSAGIGIGSGNVATDRLVTESADGIVTYYQRYAVGSKNAIGVCKRTPTDPPNRCNNTPTNFSAITPASIDVSAFNVFISPGSDPYALQPSSKANCASGLDAAPGVYGYDATNGVCTCASASDCYHDQTCTSSICMNANQQPSATLVIQSSAEQNVLETFQTTVSSRQYRR